MARRSCAAGHRYKVGTLIGAGFHSLPFVIPNFPTALTVAIIIVIFELFTIAWVRWRFYSDAV